MGDSRGVGVAVGVGTTVGVGTVSQAAKTIRNTGKASRVHHRRRLVNVNIRNPQNDNFKKYLFIIHKVENP